MSMRPDDPRFAHPLPMLNRRQMIGAAGTGLLLTSAPAWAAAAGRRFSFAQVVAQAQALARRPFRDAPLEPLARAVDFNVLYQARFRDERALWAGTGHAVELFPLNKAAAQPVHIHRVDKGVVTTLNYDPAFFDMPANHPLRKLPASAGYAGFRVMNPGNKGDWLSFLGASYFRSAGSQNQYGLSARAISINTGNGKEEEFPRFTDFWLEPGEDDNSLIVCALMDGASVTGAFRFVNRRLPDRVQQEVQSILFLRRDVAELGIAPMTSMFWYDQAHRDLARDWRPEIHDSDGLAIKDGDGERIWRPLVNPPRNLTSSFSSRTGTGGFGLIQRDRVFDHYQDDNVFYERRPSLWMTPTARMGAGSVSLYEFPTDSEYTDNASAYWIDARPARRGARLSHSYRLDWMSGEPAPQDSAHVVDVWRGFAPKEEGPWIRMAVDFVGAALNGVGRDDGVSAVVTLSAGRLVKAAAYPLVNGDGKWRLVADIDPESAGQIDLRAYLKRGDAALSETFLYPLFPKAG